MKLVILLECALYFLCRFTPKANIILYSEWQGEIRGDNSSALYALISRSSRSKYSHYIISNDGRNDSIKKLSFRGIYLQLVASKFVASNGKSDFIRCFVTRKSLYILVWHGCPIKHISSYGEGTRNNFFTISAAEIKSFIFPFTSEVPDYVLSVSPFYDSVMREAFHPRIGIIKSLQPRLISDINYASEIYTSQRSKRREFILYAPTFRDYSINYFPIASDQLHKVDLELAKHNIDLIIKPHPICTYRFRSDDYSNIKFMSAHFSVQELLFAKPKAVVTDISSVIFDSDFLSIDTIIFFPDKKKYLSHARGFIFDYQILGLVESNDFIFLIKGISEGSIISRISNADFRPYQTIDDLICILEK